jgi:large repetitive protein
MTLAQGFLYVYAPGVLGNDTGAATAQFYTSTAHGTLVFSSNGTFTYTPNAGFVGMDTFQYYAVSADGLHVSAASVTIYVIDDGGSSGGGDGGGEGGGEGG